MARSFFYTCTNGLIVKPLYLGFIDDPKSPQTIFTSEVSEKDLQDIDSVCFAPSIFQEKVLKTFDLRVTVIGEKIFTAKIETNTLPLNIPDWRYASLNQLNHSVFTLPNEIEKACICLVKRLNLEFGAIDLAVDGNGDYWFFEINPNGQWAWLETLLSFPISKAIVDLLLDSPK